MNKYIHFCQEQRQSFFLETGTSRGLFTCAREFEQGQEVGE